MAAEAPEYLSRVSADGVGQLAPSQYTPGQVQAQAGQQAAQSLGGLGNAVLGVSQQIEHVTRATNLADRTTKYMEGIDQLDQDFRNDPDPATAPQRFKEAAQRLRSEATKGFGAEDSAELNLKLSRMEIGYTGSVRTSALAKQADTYVAGVDKQFDLSARRYAGASSEAEKTAVQTELNATLDKGVKDGMLTAKAAEAYKASLTKTGDSALILRQIANNPGAAQAALSDPNQFAGLDPVTRENYAAQAKAAAEERRVASMTQTARFNPAQAAMMAGRLTDPRQAAEIFDKAFIPQESGGNANAQSVDGAAGIAQIMPGTARMLAKSMKLGDWDNLSDAEVQQKLKADPAQTRRMGIQYFQDNAAKFDGNLAPTIASYHAGPGGAVKTAHEAAVGKYGATYSPEQFLEFLPASLKDGSGKTTASYVRDIYTRMGAPTHAPGLSPMASYRASNAVGSVLDQQRAEKDAVRQQHTTLAGKQADEFAPLLKNGMVVDPQRLAPIQAQLELGVARGDPGAAAKRDQLNEHMAVAPIAQKAWSMRPEDLEAATAQMKREMAAGGDATPAKQRHLKVFEDISREMATARRDNPIALAERQGMPVTGINLEADPKSPEFGQQIMARSVVAQRAQQNYGGEHQFFRPEERVAAKARFEAAGENERFNMLKAVADNVRSEAVYRAAVKEIAGGDKYAQSAGMFMTTNPELARKIMRGSSLLELDGVKTKAEEMRPVMKTMFPAMPYPPTVVSSLMEAALAVHADKRGKSGTLWDPADRAGIEESFAEVLGPLAKLNGTKVPLPRGIPEWHVREAMSSHLLDKTLDVFGGAYGFNNERFPASYIGAHAQLRPADADVGNHRRYSVVLPQSNGAPRPVFDKTGKPLVVDLPAFVKQSRIDQDEATAEGTLFARRMNKAVGGTNRPPTADIPLPTPRPPNPFDGVQIP